MSIDSKSLNAAAVSIGQGAKSNAAPGAQTSQIKKSASSTDSRSTTVPNNTNAQRIINDMNSNSAVIAASTVTSSGPKFNPYLFPYMPQQMPMPSMSAPSAPRVASTGSRNRGDDGGGEGGGGNGGGGGGIPNNGGFNGAVPPNGDKDIGAFKKEEAPKKDEAKVDPKAEAKEPEKPTVKEESKSENKEENKPQALSMLNVGFGESS